MEHEYNIKVFFQKKAWCDRSIAVEWEEKVFRPHCVAVPMDERVLIMDNLDAHKAQVSASEAHSWISG